jgi:GxxExxY protein
LLVLYARQRLDGGYRLDLLVERKFIVELKSVEVILPVHHKQLLTYLKLSGLKLGQLINFNVDSLKDHMHRLVSGL